LSKYGAGGVQVPNQSGGNPARFSSLWPRL